ncbi:MAG: hypothetical protein ABIO54_05955 [Pyrinomonadaceae bacterium]
MVWVRTKGTPESGRKKGEPRQARLFFIKTTDSAYFALGVSTGFGSLLTFLSSAFFTSGEVPGFTGEATGKAVGLAVATGTGVATGLFGTSVFGSQAPNTATLAARTVDNINDLLIVFLLLICDADENRPLNRHPQPDDAMRLSAND